MCNLHLQKYMYTVGFFPCVKLFGSMQKTQINGWLTESTIFGNLPNNHKFSFFDMMKSEKSVTGKKTYNINTEENTGKYGLIKQIH